MNPADVLAKLGIAEGAKPEEIAAALLKFCMAEGPEADKLAVIMGVLSMLAPAPSASSASDGAAEAAAEAMADEVRKLEARVAELEAEKAQAVKAAEKAAEPTAEQRADEAIKAGRWPMGQRAALVERYRSGKEVFLPAAKTFIARSVSLTAGGNPIEQRSAPNFGNPDSPLSDVDNTVLNIAKRAGLTLTPETFAAAKAARQ